MSRLEAAAAVAAIAGFALFLSNKLYQTPKVLSQKLATPPNTHPNRPAHPTLSIAPLPCPRTARPPRGLINRQQTCFLNCVLQALASSPSFIAYINRLAGRAPAQAPDSMSLILHRLFDRLFNAPSSVFSPVYPLDLILAMKHKFAHLFDSRQQDAQEFLLLLMQLLEEEEHESNRLRAETSAGLLRALVSAVGDDDANANSDDNDGRFLPGAGLSSNPLTGVSSSFTTCTACNVSSPLQFQSFILNTSYDDNDAAGSLQNLYNRPGGDIVSDVECDSCAILGHTKEVS